MSQAESSESNTLELKAGNEILNALRAKGMMTACRLLDPLLSLMKTTDEAFSEAKDIGIKLCTVNKNKKCAVEDSIYPAHLSNEDPYVHKFNLIHSDIISTVVKCDEKITTARKAEVAVLETLSLQTIDRRDELHARIFQMLFEIPRYFEVLLSNEFNKWVVPFGKRSGFVTDIKTHYIEYCDIIMKHEGIVNYIKNMLDFYYLYKFYYHIRFDKFAIYMESCRYYVELGLEGEELHRARKKLAVDNLNDYVKSGLYHTNKIYPTSFIHNKDSSFLGYVKKYKRSL